MAILPKEGAGLVVDQRCERRAPDGWQGVEMAHLSERAMHEDIDLRTGSIGRYLAKEPGQCARQRLARITSRFGCPQGLATARPRLSPDPVNCDVNYDPRIHSTIRRITASRFPVGTKRARRCSTTLEP
jgi:hypothetical protein